MGKARKAKRAKARARAAKTSQAKAPAKPANGNKGKSTFSDYARPQATSNGTYRPAPNAIAEDDFMASLLSAVAEPSAESSRKRKSSPEMPSSDAMEPSSDSSFFSAGRKRYGMDDDEEELEVWDAKKGVMGKKPRTSEMTIVPDQDFENDYPMEVDDVPYVKAEPRDEDDDDDEMEIRPTRPLAAASTKINGATVPPRQRKVINSTSVKHIVKPEPSASKLESDVKKPALPRAIMANGKALPAGSAHWSSVQDALLPTKMSDIDEIKAPVGNVKAENVLEEDGSLRIFWLDHMERDGAIHLVGKVLDKVTKRYISACVTVNGIQRNLFVKPRTKRYCRCFMLQRVRPHADQPAGDHETDMEVTRTDVYQEFDRLRQKHGIEEWRAKFVQRKYAFEEQDVEKGESEWMKVVYGFNGESHCRHGHVRILTTSQRLSCPWVLAERPSAISLDQTLHHLSYSWSSERSWGRAGSRLRTPSSAPSLQVSSLCTVQSDPDRQASWCKIEFAVADPKSVNPMSEADPTAPKDTPPLTVMSIALRTIVNHRENKTEILCATTRTWEGCEH